MATTITGKIMYANSAAAPQVTVQVFDQDAPGKGDDDLTVSPGLSDAQGRFSVTFDPGKYLDFVSLPFLGLSRTGIKLPDPLDVLAPYLRFTYQLNGDAVTHTAALVPFQNQYHLPDAPKNHFLPSQNCFKFANLFPGFEVPFSIPFLPNLKKITGDYGLCGGMSAAASDYFLAGRTIPTVDQAPKNGTKLYRYLFRRAMDSFAMGESILRFARWMALPDDTPQGVWRLTLPELDKLRAELDGQRLAPLGLVISAGSTLQDLSQKVWLNHQVLAYGYTNNPDGSTDIWVYDPNSPGSDTAHLHVTPVEVGQGPEGAIYGARPQPVGINIFPAQVRGFFLMPYEPIEPPDGL